jgi:uncharacterized membrane protein
VNINSTFSLSEKEDCVKWSVVISVVCILVFLKIGRSPYTIEIICFKPKLKCNEQIKIASTSLTSNNIWFMNFMRSEC